MFSKYEIAHECNKINKTVDEINKLVGRYIERDITIEEAKATLVSLRATRDDFLYPTVQHINENSEYYLGMFGCADEDNLSPLYIRLEHAIAMCNSVIACIDRYIAEYYCAKVENVCNPNAICIDLKYCTDFKDLERKNKDER